MTCHYVLYNQPWCIYCRKISNWCPKGYYKLLIKFRDLCISTYQCKLFILSIIMYITFMREQRNCISHICNRSHLHHTFTQYPWYTNMWKKRANSLKLFSSHPLHGLNIDKSVLLLSSKYDETIKSPTILTSLKISSKQTTLALKCIALLWNGLHKPLTWSLEHNSG